MTGLTFADLRQANLERCGRWHPGFPSDETWTGADWSNALGGEAGELADAALAVVAYAGKVQNTVKKLRRYETGTNTATDKPLDVLLAEMDAEMADVVCYLDLLATKYGRDLAGAIIAKFNAVSERQGFPERLPGPQSSGGRVPAPIPMRLCDDAGMVSDQPVEPGSQGTLFDPGLTYRRLLNNLRAASGLAASDWPEIHCTGSAHLAGQVFRCTSPAHAVRLARPGLTVLGVPVSSESANLLVPFAGEGGSCRG